jgi:serine/threonine protein kinase
LTQKEYDSKIDVWSLGCIFSELALLNKNKAVNTSKALFRGSSCFPLSPKIETLDFSRAPKDAISKNDQIVKILLVLGQ